MRRWGTSYRRAADILFTLLISMVGLILLAPHIHLLATIAVRGLRVILEEGSIFFTGTPPPPGSGGLGGIAPAIVGSLMLGISTAALSLPLALATALLLVERPRSPLASVARAGVVSLLEMPTVLVGMMAYALVVVPLGSHSMLAGALALSVVMTPYVVVYAERALREVPREYREAGAALGLEWWRVTLGVVLRVGERGVLAGIVMGLAKALGETAPLLFTLGAQRSQVPTSLMGPGDAIPLMIYHFAATPYDNWRDLAWGGALLLLVLVLGLHLLSRRMAGGG